MGCSLYAYMHPAQRMVLLSCAECTVLLYRPADYSNFGPLVFPLLKLYFTPHPFGGNRRLLDTTPSEADAVARHTGMQLYKDGLFFTLDAVQVTPEECSQLMGELQAMVDKVMQESVHPFDR